MISVWILLISLVEGVPMARIVPRKDPDHATWDVVRPETGALGRLIYGIISIVCLGGLAFALGLRVKQFERKKKLQFAWILSHIQTILAMMLVISGAILVYGLNLTTYKQCRASITVCLFLYFSSKVFLYIFYLERIHIARLPVVFERRRDIIWIVGMVVVVGFFGGMAIWCLATPHAGLSIEDGHCRIGSDMIPSYITFSSDIAINICLTGVFVWLILPVLKNQARGSASTAEGSRPAAHNQFSLRGVLSRDAERDDRLSLSVKKMLKRNIIGSFLTFVATGINLIIYFVDATSQIAYVCFTLCIVDVVFGVLVVHWLTFGSDKITVNPNQPADCTLTASAVAFPSITFPETLNNTKVSR